MNALLFLALIVAVNADIGCYTAEVAQWTWCAGYEKAGYTCLNGFCSIDACVGTCTQCADLYPNATFDKCTARCCASLGPTASPTTVLAPSSSRDV